MTTPVPGLTGEEALLEAVRSLVIDWGVVTTQATVNGNTLLDSTKQWPVDIHANRLVKIIRGVGAGQQAWVDGNAFDTLRIRGGWINQINVGATYVILDMGVAQALRDVLGGGANISAANPLPVDTSPGVEAAQQIVNIANLAAGATSTLAQCTAVDLRHEPLNLALTVAATYNAAATLGLRVHVRTSPDNANWDTEDWDTWDAGFAAGATIRQTENYNSDPMYLRALIENLDPAQAITNLTVIASVGA